MGWSPCTFPRSRRECSDSSWIVTSPPPIMQMDDPMSRLSRAGPTSIIRLSSSAQAGLSGFAAIAVLSPKLSNAARR